MAVRVGINGFGRIGRSFTRALIDRVESAGPLERLATAVLGAEVELVAVNDPFGDNHTLAFLLKHDSVGGTLPNDIRETADGFAVDGHEIAKLACTDPAEIPWADHGVDVVIESTGVFTAREKAAEHLKGGASRVIISAPSGDADAMICLGINDSVFDPDEHLVISNASCTTNCLAPLTRVLHEAFTIEQGLITTVHAFTSDQALHDMPKTSRKGKADLRRMRAATLSIIPSSTGAARAIGVVMPELDGKLDGMSMRVPVATGSITDFVATLSREVSADEVNAAFAEASQDESYRGVLEYSEEPLVSADVVENPASCIFSAIDTMAMGNQVKVLGWYDNEWGYSNRLIDMAAFVGNG